MFIDYFYVTWQDGISEWIFLPNHSHKRLKTYLNKIIEIIQKGRRRMHQLVGQDPASIILDLSKTEVECLYMENMQWQICLSNFQGIIDNHYPKDKLFQFLKCTKWIIPKIIQSEPIPNALTFFTDGRSNGVMARQHIILLINQKVGKPHIHLHKKMELAAVIKVLSLYQQSINIVTDSEYVQ